MDEKSALNQAFKLCSKKEYATDEMYRKILEWGISEENANEIIRTLTEEKFLDDQRYAQAFINDKLKFSKWGKIKISYMLRQKGIGKPLISEALNQVDPEVYQNILEVELGKKLKSLQTADHYELKGKLIRFAMTKGFEYELSESVSEILLRQRND